MRLLKQLTSVKVIQKTIGLLAAEYLRLVWNTTRFTLEPEDAYERWEPDVPVIVVFWHGQHFLTPFFKRADDQVKALISRHRDGELNAIAVERMGIKVIRGSGDHKGRFLAKGGLSGFWAMLEALKQGSNIGLTADIPKRARIASIGVVKLAAASGRPIFPVAIATKRRIELSNWDRTAINLPFGRGACVVASPIWVPSDAGRVMLESARDELERSLNAITARVYALVNEA
ncbi:MAG: lysophospholipid acyltransferase family protein [Steroidobacteraceae bacterium]|jgi:lysophospholipid acyltransferase (LPLAT)-like uncharacterized protein